MSAKSSSIRSKGGNEPWRNRERHYCEMCNVWMGSDRQSILLHENGKKHKENLEKSLQQKRQDRLAQEKQVNQIQASLEAMNAAAVQSYLQQDLGHFAPSLPAATATATTQPVTNHQNSSHASTSVPQPPPVSSSSQTHNERQLKQEKKEWESRKKHRHAEKTEVGDDAATNQTCGGVQKRPVIGENEGFYTLEKVSIKNGNDSNTTTPATTTTYLEGVVFGDLLEEDVPVQIWTGSKSATPAEQRLVQYHHLWLDAIVVAVRKRTAATSHADRCVVDVAYLQKSSDDQETLETSVPLQRIRIILGGRGTTDNDDHDERIPSTLQEARIMAMGGQEVVEEPMAVGDSSSGGAAPDIDEATGFSSWSTVCIKRTTVRQELKEERERLRRARQEAVAEAERQAKESKIRRLEEAKAANADDSALGAYDVWNTKGGYKGVNIHDQPVVTSSEQQLVQVAQSQADGSSKTAAVFKTKAKKKKMQNRRTTSADDD